jgi:hypothetical protein
MRAGENGEPKRQVSEPRASATGGCGRRYGGQSLSDTVGRAELGHDSYLRTAAEAQAVTPIAIRHFEHFNIKLTAPPLVQAQVTKCLMCADEIDRSKRAPFAEESDLAETYTAQSNAANRAGWDAPEMADYDNYDENRKNQFP